jgi:hypothetical protein
MRKLWSLGSLIAVVLLVALVASPIYGQAGRGGQGLETAIAAQEDHTDFLLSISGVVGTAVGYNADGAPAVLIFTEAAGIPGLPKRLDGVPVVVQVTGKIYALHHCKGKHVEDPACESPPPPEEDPVPEPGATDRWPRPVPIGVSTGHPDITAGTIGARVTDGSNVYALSNNHVYANENDAIIRDSVLQPGPYDGGTDPDDAIGFLFDFEPIIFSTDASNTIDAAIALSSTADLDNATPSNGYGTPKIATVAASLNQKVQKYGRTSELTKATITGINATINVGYGSGVARFVNQITVQGIKPFIKGGDSGSLLVTDPDRNPVGLLFAGNRSGKFAVANRIDLVLTRFGVTVDVEE